MLTKEEIKTFIAEDNASSLKRLARIGERYYNADHDIKSCRLFYYNADGQLVEDKTRSNVKIPHAFFTELVDQATQYILSGDHPFIRSDIPDLQDKLNQRFNENDGFISEFMDVITDVQQKGTAYFYALMGSDGKTRFKCADSIGVIEVEGRFADDLEDHIIYWYIDRIDKEGRTIKKIQDWDAKQTYYYQQTDEGEIILDPDVEMNPRFHIVTQYENEKRGKGYGFIPFFRVDNNKKRIPSLKPIKDLIDDYDFMASSLSNNLIDFDNPLYVVQGFAGDNLDELQTNLKTKRMIGVSADGNVDVKTVDVPYEARKTKLDLDEKNIYKFGMGLNLYGLKDTSATTNIAIKSAYSLLDLRCKKLEKNIKKVLRKIINVAIDEINQSDQTGYKYEDVYFKFEHEVMSNELDNAQIEMTDAQRNQVQIQTLLSLQETLDDETLLQNICEVLELNYEDIKEKVESEDEESKTQKFLEGVQNLKTDESGDLNE